MISFLALAAAAMAVAAPSSGHRPDLGRSPVVTAVEACRTIVDNNARLACYDRAVGALATARASGEVTVVDRSQVQQVKRSLFGFGNVRLPFISGPKDTEQKELNSTLASFRPLANGYIRFSIADPDSTWESIEPSSVFEPKRGAKVTISHGAFGSYWAEIANQPAVKVRRTH